LKKFIIIILTIEYLITGIIFNSKSSLFAKENLKIYTVNIPGELKDFQLSNHLILEDINKDGLLDLIFILKDKIYISEQKNNYGFSEFNDFQINLSGAIDFGDVIPGGEKEILIMHKDGISYFKKGIERWATNPELLIKKDTIYNLNTTKNIKREHFAIDLDGNGIPELILWGKKDIHFYYKNNNEYKLIQTIPYESKEYLAYPGLVVFDSPLGWQIRKDSGNLFKNGWPVNLKYLYFSTARTSNAYLIRDFNNDLRKDLIQIKTVKKHDLERGNYTSYEYRIHFLNEYGKFSEIPDRVINDFYGSWLSSNCIDINNDGFLDFIRIEIEASSGIIKKQKCNLEVFLSNKNGTYPKKPYQIIETSDFPFGSDIVMDIDGDGKKDLILIHTIIKGFSIGSIINKFLEKGIKGEIRILPFKPGIGFSKEETIRKKIEIKFMIGIPINLSGDFDGNGKKDMLVIDGDIIRIFHFINLNKGFSKSSNFNIKIENLKNYIIKDINNDRKSDLIVFSDNHIKIIFF